MKSNVHIECQDEIRMAILAEKLASHASFPILVYLQGELGAGKTSFVRAWLRELGVTDHICSPSYTLVEPYDTVQGRYYHFDLYRLGEAEELEMLGFRDYLQAGCLIEWPERAQAILPYPDLRIVIEFALPGRNIIIHAESELGQKLIEGLTQ